MDYELIMDMLSIFIHAGVQPEDTEVQLFITEHEPFFQHLYEKRNRMQYTDDIYIVDGMIPDENGVHSYTEHFVQIAWEMYTRN